MKDFYEAIDTAVNAKTPETAEKYLHQAYVIMQPILVLARARLELRTVASLKEYMRWAVAHCIANMVEANFLEFDPTWADGYPSSMWAGARQDDRSSLDFRWSWHQDMPERWLPQVPLRTWPFFPDREVHGFARD